MTLRTAAFPRASAFLLLVHGLFAPWATLPYRSPIMRDAGAAKRNEWRTLGVCLTAAAGNHDTPIVVMARSQR